MEVSLYGLSKNQVVRADSALNNTVIRMVDYIRNNLERVAPEQQLYYTHSSLTLVSQLATNALSVFQTIAETTVSTDMHAGSMYNALRNHVDSFVTAYAIQQANIDFLSSITTDTVQ